MWKVYVRLDMSTGGYGGSLRVTSDMSFFVSVGQSTGSLGQSTAV